MTAYKLNKKQTLNGKVYLFANPVSTLTGEPFEWVTIIFKYLGKNTYKPVGEITSAQDRAGKLGEPINFKTINTRETLTTAF